ncbi:hypothetical protein SNEBB_008148 [Seison nebaliae]|nr:hypothetical protein SNEBB_008148 [Seison nebaliae]
MTKNSKNWECSACTYLNRPSLFRCEICETSRGTSSRRPRLRNSTISTSISSLVSTAFTKSGKRRRNKKKETKKQNIRTISSSTNNSHHTNTSEETDDDTVNSEYEYSLKDDVLPRNVSEENVEENISEKSEEGNNSSMNNCSLNVESIINVEKNISTEYDGISLNIIPITYYDETVNIIEFESPPTKQLKDRLKQIREKHREANNTNFEPMELFKEGSNVNEIQRRNRYEKAIAEALMIKDFLNEK